MQIRIIILSNLGTLLDLEIKRVRKSVVKLLIILINNFMNKNLWNKLK
jgi:hypothetical protein